jgi:small membrane protein
LTSIGLLGILFSLFALSRVVLRFREGRISWGMMLVWVLVWLSIIVFILSPESFEGLSKSIGIQRPLDLMLIVGLVLGYYLTFRMYVYLEELRSDLATAVREVALSGKEKGKK